MYGTSRSDTPAPVLIFLHNMRTGGDTLRTLITRQYPPGEVVETVGKHDRLATIRQLELVERDRPALVQGHIPYGLHKRITHPSTYVTMLRRPIDRVISLYYHVLEDPTSGDHRRAGPHLASLEAFVRSGLFSEVDNGQTRRISGLHRQYGQCSQEMLDVARRNLERDFLAVGLTERFDESVILMRRAYGWSNVLYHRVNATRTRVRLEDLPPTTVEVIEQYSRLDLELYEFAEELFREAVSRQSADFESELRSFKQLNAELARRQAAGGNRQATATQAGAPGADQPQHWETLLDAHAEALAREYDLIKEVFRLRRQQEQSTEKNVTMRKRNKLLRKQLQALGIDPPPLEDILGRT